MTTPSPDLITTDLVRLDQPLGASKDEVIAALAGLVADAGRATSTEGLVADAMAREEKSATGLPGGIAIPHCRSAAVTQGSLAFARLSPPVDFGAKDGPADLVFLIAAPEGGGSDHMKLLTKLARAMVKKDFVASLRAAGSDAEVVALVEGVVSPAPEGGSAPASSTTGSTTAGAAAAAPAAAAVTSAEPVRRRSVVAVTACPTGIAHTYMAADYLVASGQEKGIDVHVEPQGSSVTDPLSAEQIAAADAVIFATDVGVKGRERFAGKPVVESGVKRAINEPGVMLDEAVAAADNPSAPRVAAASGSGDEVVGSTGRQLGWGKRIQQALMTGVSYMIPFVAAGGLLIALGFLFGGYDITGTAGDIVSGNSLTNLPAAGEHALFGSALMTYIGAVLFTLGGLAFGFLVPALAGYIAFGLADRPGIAPGFVAGAVAVATGAGFIGGLVGGLLAGLVAYWFTTLRPPRWLAGLMPVVIIPLATSLVVGGLMYLFLARPLAAITEGLTDTLNGMTGSSLAVLGIVLGLMMCFDLGGPVNKAAYLFATTGLDPDNPASLKIMAAVMAAGMVPPIALALATTIRPALFSKQEKENGRAAWLLGASFISEGAIPFAAADPLRVIPSMMLGGAVTGALSMIFGAASRAPHGGIFVFFAIDRFLLFALAIAIGTVVACVSVLALKQVWKRGQPAASSTTPEPATAAA
ncbi:PTS lactose transporter subunit IIC [Janibacter melonis]|uniref:PTS lactose transporter subunit IIC n=1 Tax=Janibacter melonis TaxID=262209 RepID=A0A650GF55_9MICO|nr:fructose-specific PTS transporter subunit EIIC [Janibacter melonis]MBD5832056.1 PTS lactose transporter subunit IIC [Janibacter melonis]QGX08532.1 PTS lactose transporter subunit IIC [Janibacter melonis]